LTYWPSTVSRIVIALLARLDNTDVVDTVTG